ncbi:hypothetical protein ACHAWF_012773, partial [Thalassiosira exigua]
MIAGSYFSGRRRRLRRPSPPPAAPLVVVCSLLAAGRGANAALVLLVNNTSDGGYYSPILDGTSGKWIGEKYQDALFDRATGDFVGINQGYAFNFDQGAPGESSNYNGVFYFEDGGQMTVMNDDVVAATGAYSSYVGGEVEEHVLSYDPDYVAELTFREPKPTVWDVEDELESESGDADNFSFFITSKGGFYFAISQNGTDGGAPQQIGQMFQNPAYVPKAGTGVENHTSIMDIGINQGYSYQFPEEAFITELLGGYSGSYQQLENYMDNRHFMLERGNLTMLNEVVVHATGGYKKYVGTSIVERVVSSDPDWISEIKLEVSNGTAIAGSEATFVPVDSGSPHDLLVTFEGGWYDPMIDPDSGNVTGARFQLPVLDSNGTRVGTAQGYGFDFPPSMYNLTRPWQGSRIFYLPGGTLDVLDESVVAATGAYQGYAGGRLDETIDSHHPTWVSRIRLMPPLSSGKMGGEEAGGGNESHVSASLDEDAGSVSTVVGTEGSDAVSEQGKEGESGADRAW